MEAAGCVAAANDVSNTQQAKESQLALGGGRGLLLRGGLEHSFFLPIEAHTVRYHLSASLFFPENFLF